MEVFSAEKDYTALKNTIAGKINISDYITESTKRTAVNAWINTGGWQSWNPGYEIEPGKKQPWLNCHLIKPFNKYLNFPGTKKRISKNQVLAQFVTYLRWHENNSDFYLVLASIGNIENELPPVQFVINRDGNYVEVELCDIGKEYKKDQLQAKIEVFTAESYFECKEKLEKLFGSSDISSPNYSTRFDQIQHLGKTAYGWESWYNHYANINEKLIVDDLASLSNTQNILTLSKNANNIVFQIDDGWEQSLGDWDFRIDRFPNGLKPLTEKIEEKGYIPGLWIAPFIVDLRSKTVSEHPEWLLRDKNDHLVSAGFNFLWGSNWTFYCLDLSIPEVVDHLEKVISKAIDEWGFRYLKLDFLYAGMLNSKHQNGGASYEWYTKAIKRLTAKKVTSDGKPVCYLGCGAPFELSFKDLPLSRIGCDTYEHWDNTLPRRLKFYGRNSAYLNIKDTIGHAMWDKIIFANDPDVLFIRKENCSLSKDEKLLIAAVDAMFGSQVMYSDDPATSCSQEEVELSKEITSLQEKLFNHEFKIINTSRDSYEFSSKDNSISGTIVFGDKLKKEIHKITFFNC